MKRDHVLSFCAVLAFCVAACSSAQDGGLATAPDPQDSAAGDTGDGGQQDSEPEDTAPPDDSGSPDSAPPDSGDEDSGLGGDSGMDYDACFEDIAADTAEPAPDYAPYAPVIGSHCYGTDHQDITDVERVVFLGDSVTVGTPPSLSAEFYRTLLADELADEFGLDAPDYWWQLYDIFSGTSLTQDSGDFSCCAEWGARADDLMQDDDQVERCLPEDERDKTTLVIMTIGGNDLQNLTEGFQEGESVDELWAETEEFMALVREAVEWIKEPGRFANGVHVIFTNLYEFTDGTGDVTACPVAALAGFGAAVDDPELAWMVVWAMEEFMSIAVDTGSDMLFLLETFCGHGFNYEDPEGRCYRGEDAELWFDLTCIHPNPTGHAQIAEMFMEVVRE